MLKKPKSNYCGTVVEIKTIVPISNCDNVCHAIIMGNSVVVSKEVKVGDIGIYFPVECQLSQAYLKANNLYRKSELNQDNTQKGYFDENGRIRCIKFRGNKSEGLFMPLNSLSFINLPGSRLSNSTIPFKINGENIFIFGTTKLKVGDEFDELEGVEICRKYIVQQSRTPGVPGSRKNNKSKEVKSKLIDKQFRFHEDTSFLYKNLHHINPDDIIQISYKIHGSSFISSKLLCKKRLKWYEKVLKKIGVNIVDTEYDYLYSSRKVIKNQELNPNANHYYGEDLWKLCHDKVKDFLQDGMSLFGEVAGYLPSGGMIQKGYDYGCEPGTFKLYIYRITYTNPTGKVFEFSAKQVQDWCKANGLNPVPELYYGYARDFVDNFILLFSDNKYGGNELICKVKKDFNSDEFLSRVKQLYNEKDCYISKNVVPEEGCVVRKESMGIDAWKQKSSRFYLLETSLLDKGESNIEDEN